MPLAAAGIVAGVLILQALLGLLLTSAWAVFTSSVGLQPFPVLGFIENDVIRIVVFGVGVWLSLKYAAPLAIAHTWLRSIGRGVIAALFGALAVLAAGIVWSVLAAVNVSSYPFGYSLDPSINADALPNNLFAVAETTVSSLVEWLPLVVLVTLVAKIWLARQTAVEVTDPASRAASPAVH